MILYLIRHGRTYGKNEFLMCGSTDIELCQGGIDELKALKEKGGYPCIDGLHVYTSGMKRAEQTLEVLYGDVKHDILPDFREMDFGCFEMRRRDDPEMLAWLKQNGSGITVPFPDGESITGALTRGHQACAKLVALDQDALVVGHGALIGKLAETMFPGSFKHFSGAVAIPRYGYGCRMTFINGQPDTITPLPDDVDYMEQPS